MANEPTRITTIVVDGGDQGPSIEGRYDDGIKAVWDAEKGCWKGVDQLRTYNPETDSWEDD